MISQDGVKWHVQGAVGQLELGLKLQIVGALDTAGVDIIPKIEGKIAALDGTHQFHAVGYPSLFGITGTRVA